MVRHLLDQLAGLWPALCKRPALFPDQTPFAVAVAGVEAAEKLGEVGLLSATGVCAADPAGDLGLRPRVFTAPSCGKSPSLFSANFAGGGVGGCFGAGGAAG